MRDPDRIPEFLDVLQKIWAAYPDLRFGQLLMNAVDYRDIFYVEDDDLLQYVTYFYSNTSPKE